MALKNYYQLLELPSTAPADEIKRAFRQQIAKYHPDKVQHLGQEFQAMAAERAAELTEAYRVLNDTERRAEYDRALLANGGVAPVIMGSPTPPSRSGPEPAAPPPPASTGPSQPDPERVAPPARDRTSQDAFVKRATMGRIKQALDSVAADYVQAELAGFDFACTPRRKLFLGAAGPRLLGRFAPVVDGRAVIDTWTKAAQWDPKGKDDVCVFLIGTSLSPAGDLAKAINEARRRTRDTRVILIPVDGRNWDAHMPLDAPAIAKTLLTRLRSTA